MRKSSCPLRSKRSRPAADGASEAARTPEVAVRKRPDHNWNALLAVSSSAFLGRVLAGGDGMDWEDRISVDPEVRSGKPCIKGTRITLYDLLEYLAGGMSESQILEDFPGLKVENIRACLAFAAARERRLSSSAE